MAKVVRKEQCPICQDSGCDNLAIYDDGTTYCFACENFEGINTPWLKGACKDISIRKITKSTCEQFNYEVGVSKSGTHVHIANYLDSKGRKIAQKLRTKDKKFTIIGKGRDLPLYGQWKYSPNPNISIVVVEGEIDCLTVAQETGFQRPVVSLPSGASTARKAIEKHLAWLSGFKYVVLAFDNDEAGREATQKCIDLFEPGKVRLATWLGKDANDMLLNGHGKDIASVIYKAKSLVPERLVTVKDIMSRILQRPEMGPSWPWKSLTDITYGMQTKEISIVVAANSVGKTEFVKEIIFHMLNNNINVGLFSFEQSPEDTMRRMIGSKLGLKLHLPGCEWDENKIKEAAASFDDRLFLYDKAGSGDDEEIMSYIRYLAKAKNVKLVVIDNLKGLGGVTDNERMINNMKKFQTIKMELDIHIILLSHVSKDKIGRQAYVSTSPKRAEEYASLTADDINQMVNKAGLEWESGRMPSKENVEGSSAVCDLADYVFALARNTTSTDEIEKRTTNVRVLKARRDGTKQGTVFKLYYNNQGQLEEPGANQTDIVFNTDLF